MIHYYYFLILASGLFGMTYIDRQYKLALWSEKRRAAFTILTSVAYLLVWDVSGLALHLFSNNPRYTIGIGLTPNLPLEEFMLLTLISYMTLLITVAVRKRYA